MRLAMFSTKPYDRRFFDEANAEHQHTITYFETRLSPESVAMAEGMDAVCVFVNDQVDVEVLAALAGFGCEVIVTRSAGFNHIDLDAARAHGLRVGRVPAYSPHAVAEHAVALILALDRKIHRAYNRVREGNFELQGLLGFDLHGRDVGVIGTGKIGRCFLAIMAGFGCNLIAYDPYPHPDCEALGVRYLELEEVLRGCDILSLHCPLTPETRHLIDERRLAMMRDGVMIINTGRGDLIDTPALIGGLKRGKIGYLGLDVYEEEEELFFRDLSDSVIQDDVLMRLTTFPNVLITAHQGFFTREALHNIAAVTLGNVTAAFGGAGTFESCLPPQG